MTDTQVTWLTQESHDRLKAELDQLIANRPVIAAEINERREEGDLRENGGYHAAREEQGQQGGAHPSAAGTAQQRQGGRGAHPVRRRAARFRRQGLLRRRQGRHRDLPHRHPSGGRQGRQARGVLPSSPLGGALIDAKVGETRSYTVPNGTEVQVTLVSAEPYHE